jgi:uncharacterized protein YyaL (SSP411 family)
VDAELRPDIADRYTLGGWPTTAFLTTAGEPLAGGTFLDADQLLSALTRLASLYAQRREALLLPSDAAPDDFPDDRREPDLGAPAAFEALLRAGTDGEHGGFGGAPKLPHAAALRFLIQRSRRTGDAAALGLATEALRAMAVSELHDTQAGGFFRAASCADWSSPDPAKLLDVQAALLRLYAEAWASTRDAVFRETAIGIVRYLEDRLRDPVHGAFYSSECLPGTDAEPRSDTVDVRLFVDANARLASSYLHTSSLLGDDSLAETAIAVIEHVVSAAYARGAGVAHWLDPRPRGRGLLGSQVAVSAALLDAWDVTTRSVYRDLAEELMRSCLRHFWDEHRRALRDRVGSDQDGEDDGGAIGRLATPLFPLAPNCEAAIVLHRLAAAPGDDGLELRAREILASFAVRWRAEDLEGAPYAIALDELGLS